MTDLNEERIKDSALGSDLTNKITDSTNLPNLTVKQNTAKAMSQNTTDSLPKKLKARRRSTHVAKSSTTHGYKGQRSIHENVAVTIS